MYFARILALRDLDQTGKNGFHANPNFNKMAQQQPGPVQFGSKLPRIF
jgi:hypothetical protein